MIPLTTRFAPSPTGPLHLGGARTALFNWLAARSTGGKFILRIDDTDRERSQEAYVDDIKRGLEWLGLDWDDEFRQSDRLDRHRAFVEALWALDYAEEIEDGGYALRLRELPINSWQDRVLGEVPISSPDAEYIKTAVLARAGGFPLYHPASVIDDLDHKVDLVIRGVDHVANTALHSVLTRLWSSSVPGPEYAHVGLIHGADGKKLSKRAPEDMTLLSEYIDSGIHPAAMLNFLLRLGWGPRVDDRSTAVITRERALELFMEGGNLRSSPAKFDAGKLASFDRKFKALSARQNLPT